MREGIEERLGYSFRDPLLLQAVLHHPSLSKLKETSPFQRLEFLGDRVLGLVIALWLYELYPEEAEGPLAIRHSALVNRCSLRNVAVVLGLQEVVQCDQQKGSPRLYDKILADSCEALLGALFLDGGLALATQKIKKWWAPLVEDQKDLPVNGKSLLQEWAQARQKPKPVYEVLEISGPPHQPIFKVQVLLEGYPPVESLGSSRKKAQLKAAEALLELLNRESHP
jgi:ribonuclease-3